MTIYLSLILLVTSINAFAQSSFDAFWKDFKASISKGDKNAVADFAKFPLEMPYGMKIVKTKTDFLKRYREIFDGEADAAKCFAQAKPEKEDAKHYAVYCGFKKTPNDMENTPIKYSFELTKTGWKFAGLDNINE